MSNDEEEESSTTDEVRDTTENVPTRWTPGMPSPNPAGRPKMPKSVKEVKALAREHTHLAISTLAKIAGNPKAPTPSRVAASEALLARGWGRAPVTDLENVEGLIVQIMKFNSPRIEDDSTMKVIEQDEDNDDDGAA